MVDGSGIFIGERFLLFWGKQSLTVKIKAIMIMGFITAFGCRGSVS